MFAYPTSAAHPSYHHPIEDSLLRTNSQGKSSAMQVTKYNHGTWEVGDVPEQTPLHNQGLGRGPGSSLYHEACLTLALTLTLTLALSKA